MWHKSKEPNNQKVVAVFPEKSIENLPNTFVQVKKIAPGVITLRVPPEQVSISKTTISFGTEVIRWLKGEYLEIFVNEKEQFIAFKPSDSSHIDAFRLYGNSKDRRCSRINSSKIFRGKKIKFGRYDAKWSEAYNVVVVKYLTENKPPMF